MNARVAGVGCALAAALSAAAASAATPPVAANGATTATLSSTKAGAKPVALTLTVHYEMVCGRPGRGTAIVTLPEAAAVPASIARSAVLVDGEPAPSVSVSGHDVSIAMPLTHGVTCMSIGPGTLTLTLTRAARMGNPKSPGTYTVRIRRGTRSFQARVHISA